LDALLAERVAEDREKNLRRLYLFSDRLDYSENAETLRRFAELVKPFAGPYQDDRDFAVVFDGVRELQATLEHAEALLEESRPRDCLKVCNDALEKRPNNVLFRRLEEKAKGREWVSLLAQGTVDRARAFQAQAQYAEALGEWESLRGIDPHYPGLESEILNCAALSERSGGLSAKEQVAEAVQESEFVVLADEQAEIEPLPSLVDRPRANSLPLGIRISMTEEAWNHFKTGLAATGALLLVVLVLASHSQP
jgi:tetratricopeptide (TPR) repeat protein